MQGLYLRFNNELAGVRGKLIKSIPRYFILLSNIISLVKPHTIPILLIIQHNVIIQKPNAII